MHILVVNDDGPPSNQSSPYVHSFIKTLREAGHEVSVILPHTQRSWIGKAHHVSQVVKPTYFRPGTLHEDDGITSKKPFEDGKEEWILVNGTPATCTQLGLFHFFKDKPPVDIVVSGPNYGRNSTAVFSLSSGTIGGAMEAATCRKKAIALSYAFYDREMVPSVIAAASLRSVRLIEHLITNWSSDVDLYSINVPLKEGLEDRKVMYTNVLQNYWPENSSAFAPYSSGQRDPDHPPEDREEEIRKQEAGEAAQEDDTESQKGWFCWAPDFAGIWKTVDDSEPGNDGWAIREGYTSVTPLKANFMHSLEHPLTELKLESTSTGSLGLPLRKIEKEDSGGDEARISAYVNYADQYVQPLIVDALKEIFPRNACTIIESPVSVASSGNRRLVIVQYESIPFSDLLERPQDTFANAYIIRKALIRKHYIANTVRHWQSKRPENKLQHHVKESIEFELDYAEFLDEALIEAYELKESWAANEEKSLGEREWWILKPGMSDRGQGIRLFSSEEELIEIFEGWEEPDDQDEKDQNEDNQDGQGWRANGTEVNGSLNRDPTKGNKGLDDDNGVMTSQLRHFIAQPYISNPLLFPEHQNRKFHVRTYVLAVGALQVYVYQDMLALFSTQSYTPPGRGGDQARDLDLSMHLTNTCLQDGTREGSVHRFWDLPPHLPKATPLTADRATKDDSTDWRAAAFSQIKDIVAETFLAAATTQSVHFQALPNSFEIFGIDFLIDERGHSWLLEVNAFPDFGQSGGDDEGKGVVRGLWKGAMRVIGREFFGFKEMGKSHGDNAEEGGPAEDGMIEVLRVDLGRR
ncbi:hypothetical protein MMC25_003887 [Agyrium rufum]|nr:hypothetical protein [Agyrium rufum]